MYYKYMYLFIVFINVYTNVFLAEVENLPLLQLVGGQMEYAAWLWEATELGHHSSVFWSLFHLKVDVVPLSLKLLYNPIAFFYQKTWKW